MRVEFTRYQRTKFTALTVFAGLDRVRPADKNTVKNLRRYDEQHFNRLGSLLVNFCANNHVEKIFVGHPSSVSPLLLYSPDEVVLAAFKCCLNITVLDLRNLSEGVARVKQVMASLPQQYSPTLVQVTDLSPVLGLLTLIQEQSSALKVIEQNSSSCVDDVFVAINLAGEQLGFLNMTTTRQIDDDEWLRLCRIHGDRSAVRPFSLDEAGPTIKSIFDSPNIFFDVDIADLVKGINEYFGKSVEEFVADLMVKNNIDDLSELSVDYSQWGIEVSPLLTLPSFEAAGIIPNLKSLLIELIETKGPTRYLFVKMVSAYGVEAVVHLHNRVKKNSSVDPKPVFSESEDVTRGIKKALEVYFTGAVRAIERIRGRQAQLSGPVEAENHEMLNHCQQPFSSTQFHGASEIFRSGSFATEYNDNPAKNFRSVWPHVYRAFNNVVIIATGSSMESVELQDHVYVSHCLIDRKDTEVTGFAVSDDYNDFLQSNGKMGRLVYYAGIMINKDCRGGRFAFLTFHLLTKIFKGIGFFSLLFSKTPLTYRTQDKRVHALGVRYFNAKSEATSFTAKDWAAVEFLSKKQGWTIEAGNNIFRGVYSRAMADDKRFLMDDLGERDGKVCIGYITWPSVVKLYWDVWFNKKFRLKAKKSNKEDW